MRRIDGSASIQNRSVAPCMSLKMTYCLQSSALVSPHIFSQHQAAFLGHRWKDIRVIPRQEAKPPGKTSELCQDRRPNHQERHQSYPKTGGKTTRKDIRVIPRQEAKPPGKTSELSQDGRREGVAPSMWHILVGLVYGCREI